jgi:hypothetical protein
VLRLFRYEQHQRSGTCSRHGRNDKWMHTVLLVANLEGQRPLGRMRHRLEDNIKTDLKEIGCENVDWIHLATGSCDAVMSLRAP